MNNRKRNVQRRFFCMVMLLMFFINLEIASAFQDIYEPDNSLEQARPIIVGDEARQQHTLHSLTDEDWFKFYAMAGKLYRIKTSPVGMDIDVAIDLYDSDGNRLFEKAKNDGFEGEAEFFSWIAPSEGFYYVKINDSLPESENCRKDIQYELRVFDPAAVIFDGRVKAVLIDAISGQVIEAEDAMFYTIYEKNNKICENTKPSKEETDPEHSEKETNPQPSGHVLKTPSGPNDLIAMTTGYQRLRCCNVNMIEDAGTREPMRKDMPLLPNNVEIPAPSPSKAIYHRGETLHIEFQASLPHYSCLRYYFAIAYPDGRFFMIKAENQLELLNPSFLPRWEDINYEPNSVLIDRKIDNSMPSGEYQLYTLRISESIEDIVNNLELGEYNVGQFRIE